MHDLIPVFAFLGRKVHLENEVSSRSVRNACHGRADHLYQQAPRFVSIERFPEKLAQARQNLERAGLLSMVELIEGVFGTKKCCCGTCCEGGCCNACGCNGAAPATKAPAAAPAKAPEQAAPLPAAPKADPSASIESRGIYQAARSLVRN